MRILLHLHDTHGMGRTKMFSGYEAGVRTFGVCAGGFGGCPFVKGSAGNVPSEYAVNMFKCMGGPSGVYLMHVCEAATYLESDLKRPPLGRMQRVLQYQRNCDGG